MSQNLMHHNLNTTDAIYAILSGNDVQGRISTVGLEKPEEIASPERVISLLEQLLAYFKGQK